jgi:hypothetical protein
MRERLFKTACFLLLCASSVLIVGCAAKPDLLRISLRYDPWAYREARLGAGLPVRDEPDVARGELAPIAGAHVRAVSLGMNDLGLPVSGATLAELEAAESRTGDITGRDGSATLYAVAGRDVLIEVKPPVLGGTFQGEGGVWAWWAERLGSGLRVIPDDGPHRPPAFVELRVID